MPTEPPKAEPPKRKRRWLQFSLRSLMIVVTAVGVSTPLLINAAEAIHEAKESAWHVQVWNNLFDPGGARRFISPSQPTPETRTLDASGRQNLVLQVPAVGDDAAERQSDGWRSPMRTLTRSNSSLIRDWWFMSRAAT